jgi:hypothetical protein
VLHTQRSHTQAEFEDTLLVAELLEHQKIIGPWWKKKRSEEHTHASNFAYIFKCSHCYSAVAMSGSRGLERGGSGEGVRINAGLRRRESNLGLFVWRTKFTTIIYTTPLICLFLPICSLST